MDKYGLIYVLICLASTSNSKGLKTYRSDYEYRERTDAFYKLHIEQRRGWKVKEVCAAEGATLMIPTDHEDLAQVHGMMKQYPDLGRLVYVGNDGFNHESDEGAPIIDLSANSEEVTYNTYSCTVVTRDGLLESIPCYRPLPFVCKVAAKDARYDPRCGVYGTAYEYVSSVKSCYKIPPIAFTWNEAYAGCRAEGSHLVVINSETEQDVIKNMINTANVKNTMASHFFYAGFRADVPANNERIVFKTIFNQTLDEAGFNQWCPNEPNNARGREFCGTIYKGSGKFNDVDCTNEYGFICEKEVTV